MRNIFILRNQVTAQYSCTSTGLYLEISNPVPFAKHSSQCQDFRRMQSVGARGAAGDRQLWKPIRPLNDFYIHLTSNDITSRESPTKSGVLAPGSSTIERFTTRSASMRKSATNPFASALIFANQLYVTSRIGSVILLQFCIERSACIRHI